ncbi:MAG: hypothetical protein ACRC8Y_11260, partial [Chroococcales cyanobacterium]
EFGEAQILLYHFTAKTEFRIDQFQTGGGDRLSITPVAALLLRLGTEQRRLDVSAISIHPDPS